VEYAILIIYYYQTATPAALYEYTEGPAAIPPNSFGLVNFDRTIPESSVQMQCQPGWPICQWFGSRLDPNPKRRLGTVANITHDDSIGHPRAQKY